MADQQVHVVPVAATGKVLIDPRGQRFAAAVTTVVLAAVLLTIPTDASALLLAVQGLVFAAAAFFGLKAQLYGVFFRYVVRPRLGPAPELEEENPPRFAQLVGFGFVLVAVMGLAFSWLWLAYLATALALAAAFLNAAFNYCLGCQMYLLARRVTSLPERG